MWFGGTRPFGEKTGPPVVGRFPSSMASNDDPKKKNQDTSLENLGMGELLDLYDKKMATFAEGEIVRGRVVKVTPTEAIIDIGYKSEGLLAINQITGYDGQVK